MSKASNTPFVYVAEKNGRCWGVNAGDYQVARFYKSFAGYDIKAMATEQDWINYHKSTPFGHPKPGELLQETDSRPVLQGSRNDG